jgi:hypothetical protein
VAAAAATPVAVPGPSIPPTPAAVTLSAPAVAPVPSLPVDLGSAAILAGGADQLDQPTAAAVPDPDPALQPQAQTEPRSVDQTPVAPTADPAATPDPGRETAPQAAPLPSPRIVTSGTTVLTPLPLPTAPRFQSHRGEHKPNASAPKPSSRRGIRTGAAFAPPPSPSIAVGTGSARSAETLTDLAPVSRLRDATPSQSRASTRHPARRGAARPALPRLPDQGTGLGAGAAGSGGGSSGSGMMALIAAFVFLSPGLTRWLRVGRGRLPRLLRAGRLERPG